MHYPNIWFNDEFQAQTWKGMPIDRINWRKTFMELTSHEAQDLVAVLLSQFLGQPSLQSKLRLMNASEFEKRIRRIV